MAMRDLPIIGVTLFAFALIAFLAFFITQTFVDSMIAIPAINSTATQDAVQTLEDTKTLMSRTDYLGMGVFIGVALFIIISGYFAGGEPVFTVIYLVIMVISVVISPILSNLWEDVTGMVVFGTTISSFPLLNHIILKLPIYVTVIGFMGIIAMYARSRVQTL